MSSEEHKNSALHHLMQSAKRAKKKHSSASPRKDQSGFFPCPAGCGHHVSERNVNVHLDKLCSVLNGGAAAAASVDKMPSPSKQQKESPKVIGNQQTNDLIEGDSNESCEMKTDCITPPKSIQQSPYSKKSPNRSKQNMNNSSNQQNAFSHMMKQSAKVFNNSESITKHKFHLYSDQDGRITTTWISDDHTDATIAMDDVLLSATVTVKKIKSIPLNQSHLQELIQQSETHVDATTLELIVSSSIPFQQSQHDDNGSNKFNFVQRHSRLSVPHLKSILQKSIRRRAPLPAVRVALELSDRSFGDLIRRLPIIILEDSFLHDEFDLLVWLMVAESKGYVPPMSLMIRVFQIVFEMASCPRRDDLISDMNSVGSDLKLSSFSLTTPTSRLFPAALSNQTSVNKCDALIRAMLLRAQYGGMACDVSMLNSYASLWLQRFHSSELLTNDTIAGLPKSKLLDDKGDTIHMKDLPQILHEPSYQKSKELITREVVAPGGLVRLTETDICCSGIDFHCSPVVESLLSQVRVYSALCERLSSNDRDWISSQVKTCIWNYSSGVNRRLALNKRHTETDQKELALRGVWNDILKNPFNEYTKSFVRQRLA